MYIYICTSDSRTSAPLGDQGGPWFRRGGCHELALESVSRAARLIQGTNFLAQSFCGGLGSRKTGMFQNSQQPMHTCIHYINTRNSSKLRGMGWGGPCFPLGLAEHPALGVMVSMAHSVQYRYAPALVNALLITKNTVMHTKPADMPSYGSTLILCCIDRSPHMICLYSYIHIFSFVSKIV